jgi:hypothetical protein
MDEKACWFAAIVSAIWRTVFLDVVFVEKMDAQERGFACALVEALWACDCEINEANRCLE